MKSLKANLPWIAPTAAVLFSAGLLGTTGVLQGGKGEVAETKTAAPERVANVQAATVVLQPEIVAVEPKIAAVVNDEIPEKVDGLQILNSLKRATANGVSDFEVTRSEPISLLDTSSVIAPQVEAKPVIKEVDSSKAADFFASAQANLAADDSCGEDMRALAQNTRVYFPAGGLTVEDSGLFSARVIGQLAVGCSNYTLQVQGHSDPSGNSLVNMELSKKRAEAVIARLASGGIDTSSFVAVGMGDKIPSNLDGPEGAAYYDRRVEFAVVEKKRTASVVESSKPWASAASECVSALENKVAQTRLFYATRAITVSPSEMEGMYELARDVANCEGARLRVVGHHTDQIGARESYETGRLRALVLMGALVSAGYDSEKTLIAAPSYSVPVPNQPGLPKTRVDFQIVTD